MRSYSTNPGVIIGALVIALCVSPLSFAAEHPKVGGFEQFLPGESPEESIGAGWGHRSMSYGMMNLMSGMTMQIASILRTGKTTPEMLEKLSRILDHIAEMLNDAPSYMMGTKAVDSEMVRQMHEMLKEIEKMRKEIHFR